MMTVEGRSLKELTVFATMRSSRSTAILGDVFESYLLNLDFPLQFNSELLRGPVVQDQQSYLRTGTKPVVVRDRYIAAFSAWSNYLTHVKQFMTGWDFSQDTSISLPGENPIVHHNVMGHLTATLGPSLRNSLGGYQAFRVTSSSRPVGIEADDYCYVAYLGTVIDPVNPSFWDYTDPLGVSYHFDRLETVSGRTQYRVLRTWTEGSWVKRRSDIVILQYECSISLLPSTLGTLCPLSQYANAGYYHFSHRNWSTQDLIGYTPMYTNDDLDAMSWFPDVSVDYYHDYPDFRYQLGDLTRYSFTHVLVDRLPAQPARLDDLLGYEEGRFVDRHPYSFGAYQSLIAQVLPNCYAGNYISFNDAVDANFSRVKGDHIEFLMELKDILSPLDLVRALMAARRLAPSHILPALLKILASAKLCWSLAVAPTIADAEDTALKARSILKRFSERELFSIHESRGKAQLVTLMYEPFSPLKITCRSKVSLRVLSDSYIPFLLGSRSIGLLPSLSSAWNLIPMSFVIDWFLPVGNVLDNLETTTLALLVEALPSVHSIQIDYDVTNLLASYNMEPVASSSPFVGYRFFERYTMDGVLTPCGTRLPWYGGTGVPDWGTALSLLYLKIL